MQLPPHVHPRLPTIRFRLALLVLSCVLPAAIVSAFLIYDHYRVERASLLGEAMATARSMVAVVDRDFDTVVTALTALSVSDDIDEAEMAEFGRQAANVHAILPITEIVLYEAQSGRQLMNTAQEAQAKPVAAPANTALLREVLRTTQPVVTGLTRGSAGQTITVGVPVVRNGAVRYVLAAQVLPESLNAILRDQQVPATWRATILDAGLRIVARNVDTERYRGTLPDAGLVERMRRQVEDTFDGATVDGNR
ncbi:MAG TPA: cache domain-containing protein, partial [Pseudoduganella sp.]